MKLTTSIGIIALLAPIWVFNVGSHLQHEKRLALIAAFNATHPRIFALDGDYEPPTEWWHPPSAFETPDSDQWIIGERRYTGRALMGVRL
jgi:hypothetical protein